MSDPKVSDADVDDATHLVARAVLGVAGKWLSIPEAEAAAHAILTFAANRYAALAEEEELAALSGESFTYRCGYRAAAHRLKVRILGQTEE